MRLRKVYTSLRSTTKNCHSYQSLQVFIRVHFYFACQRTIINQCSAMSFSSFYVPVKAVVACVHFTTNKPLRQNKCGLYQKGKKQASILNFSFKVTRTQTQKGVLNSKSDLKFSDFYCFYVLFPYLARSKNYPLIDILITVFSSQFFTLTS